MRRFSAHARAVLGAALLFAFLPATAQPARVVAERVASEAGAYRVVQVASGLEHPWAIAFLPDGRMLVTERPGRMNLIAPDGTRRTLDGVPRVFSEEDQMTAPQGGSQSGLMDVVLHPDFASNGWIYFTYSSPGDDDTVTSEDTLGTATALARARLSADGTRLEAVETLYAQMPRHNPGRHYGSRIAFPGDGSVLFTIGDRGLRRPAQDLTDPAGSVIRLLENGGPHPANPFVGVPPGNLRPEIFSFGHRNSQGMLIAPDGTIWAHEHGPYGGDVLFVYREGRNYGWPQVAQGVEYSTGEKIGVGHTAPGVEAPVYVWTEAIAPSGNAFPGWRGNLFVGSLLQKQIRRLVLDGERVVSEEVLLDDLIGRVRDVRVGPDGFLYVVTDESNGGVYRIEPAG
jgi:glucose/arabinose dehydrogenase